jgi:peptide/nickel transport system ATP-binding protein
VNAAARTSATPVLDAAGLTVRTPDRTLVHGVDLTIAPGECVALVGPSGSGKTVIARALLGLAAPGLTVAADTLDLDGTDMRRASDRRWRRTRGTTVGYVGQEALGALDPLRPVGREVADALRLHTDLSARERVDRVREVLGSVGLDPAIATDGRLAGTLSGGMRQRALIAAAIVGSPRLVVADEPTTALDADVAGAVVDVLRGVQARGAGLLVITHDLGLVAGWADRVAIVSDGRLVETGRTADVLESPASPVGRELVAAARRATTAVRTPPETAATDDDGPAPCLQAVSLRKTYDRTVAVDGVSLALRRGRTLGVVGPSGSGKTTLVRMLLGLVPPDAGTVTLDGEPWAPLPEAGRRGRRGRVAAVVQDPGATFDERWSVERVLADALSGGTVRRATGALSGSIDAALARVGLDPSMRSRAPRTLSGGPRQRLAIARALATDPEVLVLDEPVTALDAAVQDQVLALLERVQRESGVAMLFVSHDRDAVRRMSDELLDLGA